MADTDGPIFNTQVRSFFRNTLRFNIKEVIGSGNFGSVARAEYGEPKKICAIKLIKRIAGSEVNRRLVRREMAAMALVDHPNCCTLAKIVEFTGHCALVMEFCAGGSLGSYLMKLKRHEFVPPYYAALWSGQLTSVVHALHHRYHIVHRDIKPDNVFFDGHFNVKLGDFGFAKSITANVRNTNCGSELFTPPEMHRDGHGDGTLDYSPIKLDIWGLGLIIHLIYANDFPYTMDQLRQRQPPRIEDQLNRFRELIPVEVRNILLAALEPDPKKRATSCALWLDPWFRARRVVEKDGLHPV